MSTITAIPATRRDAILAATFGIADAAEAEEALSTDPKGETAQKIAKDVMTAILRGEPVRNPLHLFREGEQGTPDFIDVLAIFSLTSSKFTHAEKISAQAALAQSPTTLSALVLRARHLLGQTLY